MSQCLLPCLSWPALLRLEYSTQEGCAWGCLAHSSWKSDSNNALRRSQPHPKCFVQTRNFSVHKKQCGSYKFLYPVTFPWPSDYFLQSGAQASKLPTLPLIQLCFWQSSFTEKIILYIRCFLWPVPRSLYLITYIYIYICKGREGKWLKDFTTLVLQLRKECSSIFSSLFWNLLSPSFLSVSLN